MVLFPCSGAVTADNSVMRYGPKEGPGTYSHPEFVPIFLDEQPAEVRSRAEAVCGDNLACIYDYVATGSEAFALDSKSVKERADQTNELTSEFFFRLYLFVCLFYF